MDDQATYQAAAALEESGRSFRGAIELLTSRGYSRAIASEALRQAVSLRPYSDTTVAERLLSFASEEWQEHERLLARVECGGELPRERHEKREALYQLVSDGKLETQRSADGAIEYRLPSVAVSE